MRAYRLDEFPEFKEAPKLPALASASTVDLADVVPIDIDKLSTLLPEDIRRLVLDGDDLDDPIGSQGARFPSRSEVVFAAGCGMARAGFDEMTIAGVFINESYKISASIIEKQGRAKKYALKQARAAITAVANTLPDMSRTGPRATLRNTIVALQKLELRFAHDLFRRRNFVHGHQLDAFRGEMTDDLSAMLRRVVLDDFAFDPGKEHVRDAVHMLCLANRFHPIRDYLGGLKWDGTPRLDSLFPGYFGAEDTVLNRAFGKIMLIAAARRVRHPGTKFDQIVVLEGAQGTGKSTAIAILAGPESHSDQDILTLDSKGQIEMLEGVWLYEIGELEGLGRADVAKVKAFASRQTDRARMAYAYFREDRARECIFIGTTNDSHYLTDQTGNRRFWPVKTAQIDLERLRRDRDQLWAEAAHREAAEEPITLPPELWENAAVEQAARTMRDPGSTSWKRSLVRRQPKPLCGFRAAIFSPTLCGLSQDAKSPATRHDLEFACVCSVGMVRSGCVSRATMSAAANDQSRKAGAQSPTPSSGQDRGRGGVAVCGGAVAGWALVCRPRRSPPPRVGQAGA